jgi:hypothetical protein
VLWGILSGDIIKCKGLGSGLAVQRERGFLFVGFETFASPATAFLPVVQRTNPAKNADVLATFHCDGGRLQEREDERKEGKGGNLSGLKKGRNEGREEGWE